MRTNQGDIWGKCMASKKPKKTDALSFDPRTGSEGSVQPSIEEAEDHLFEDGYYFDRRITRIEEFFLLDTVGMRLEAATWERFMLLPLDTYWSHYKLEPTIYSFDETVAFSLLVHKLVDDLNEFAEAGRRFTKVSCRHQAATIKIAWRDFQRVSAEFRAQREIQIRKSEKQQAQNAAKLSGGRGGSAGRGKPKIEPRDRVKEAFRTQRGDRTVQAFLDDWIRQEESYCGVGCMGAATGYEFRTDDTNDVWIASPRAIGHLATEVRNTESRRN